MIDLHVHSNKSDGSDSPADLVAMAEQKGITAFALTDHDTMSGVGEALAAAEGTSVTVIPGIELSSHYLNKEIHVVGLYVNQNDPEFSSYLKQFVESRSARNRKMCELLTEAGMEITYEELCESFPDSILTRAHIARLLHKKNYVTGVADAFERYLGDHCPYYVQREKLPVENAIRLIKNAGGIAVLAHPTLYHMGNKTLHELVRTCKEAGLDAIETKYVTYSSSDERQIKEIAAEFGLARSGGSDYHGIAKPKIQMGTGYGRLYIDDSFLTELLKDCNRG